MPNKLTKRDIISALEALNKKLVNSGVKAEICLYGGTVMVLAFNTRLATKDIDAVFSPKGIVRELATSVAEDRNLNKNWLNDGVKGFLSDNPKFTSHQMPLFSNLQITRPTSDYLLAMKCLAARAPGYDTQGDRADILFLMQHLNITEEKEVLDIIESFYPKDRILPKTQFFVMECLSELKR